MLRKILIFIVILLMPTIINAKVELSLNTINSRPNETVELDLNIKNNEGIGYFNCEIVFDNNKVEYIDSKILGLENALLKEIVLNIDNNLSFYAITIDENKLIDDNDKILNIKFKIKDHISGDIPITIENVSIGKDENIEYDYVVKNGLIHVLNQETVSKDSSINLNSEISSNVNEKDIVWSSTNPDVGNINDGKLSFYKSGKTTVVGKLNDEIIYEKEFIVNNPIKHMSIYILLAILLVIIIFIVIYLIKRKNKKKFN